MDFDKISVSDDIVGGASLPFDPDTESRIRPPSAPAEQRNHQHQQQKELQEQTTPSSLSSLLWLWGKLRQGLMASSSIVRTFARAIQIRSMNMGRGRRVSSPQLIPLVFKLKDHIEEDPEEEDEEEIDNPVERSGLIASFRRKSRQLSRINSNSSSRSDDADGEEESKGTRKESVETLSSLPSSSHDQEETNAEERVSYREKLLKLQHLLNWSVDPDGAFVFYWKFLVTLTIIYNCVVIILRTAFLEMRAEETFDWLNKIGDVIFLLDILIDAKTAFLRNGCLVEDTHETYKWYTQRSDFIYDLIAVCPVFTAANYTLSFLSLFRSQDPILEMLTTHLPVYQPVLRLNRLLKCHAMNSFFQRTESRTNTPNLLRAFKLSLHLGLVIHWIACLYYMLSEYEGLGSTEWVYPSGPNSTRFSKKYIVCMFWSTMTLTTIGEREPPVTEIEFIFTGFTFLVGVFVFAAVVGNVGDVISNMNAARRDFQARMDQIKFYLNHRNVPEHLQTRIKRWAEYTWDRTKAIDEPHVLAFLPDRLRTEVAIHVHLDVLKRVTIFDECEEGLLRELVLKLKSQIYSPGDYICRIGEIGREMYIINHGKVEILYPDSETGAMRQVSVMTPGNFFGEISLLKLDEGQNKRTADVRSLGFSELLCLSRRDLMLALTEYPDAKKVLEEYARQRFNNTKKMATTESAEDSPTHSITRTPQSPLKRSVKHVFARVMRQEGFSNLLDDRKSSSDLIEIKNAVHELKQTKQAEEEEIVVSLHQRIHQLEGIVLEKNLELQEARAQVAYLETVVRRMNHEWKSQDITSKLTSPFLATRNVWESTSALDLAQFRWPDLHRAGTQNHNTQAKLPNSVSADFSLGGNSSSQIQESPKRTDVCEHKRTSYKETSQPNVRSEDDDDDDDDDDEDRSDRSSINSDDFGKESGDNSSDYEERYNDAVCEDLTKPRLRHIGPLSRHKSELFGFTTHPLDLDYKPKRRASAPVEPSTMGWNKATIDSSSMSELSRKLKMADGVEETNDEGNSSSDMSASKVNGVTSHNAKPMEQSEAKCKEPENASSNKDNVHSILGSNTANACDSKQSPITKISSAGHSAFHVVKHKGTDGLDSSDANKDKNTSCGDIAMEAAVETSLDDVRSGLPRDNFGSDVDKGQSSVTSLKVSNSSEIEDILSNTESRDTNVPQ